MNISLDWLGCATFRLTIDGLVVFLDAYMDRVPGAPPVGLTTREVTKADYVLVGHSHFDHLAGAEVIAANTGAKIIGSTESCRVMRECGIADDQLLASQGGEHWRLRDDITVRVFPSLHSCTWTSARLDNNEPCFGELGLTEEERTAMARQGGLGAAVGRLGGGDSQVAREMREHVATAKGSGHTGGALAYLINTPQGSIFYHDTSGYWTGVLRDLRPDVAIIAAAGRGNIDGEPIQGTLTDFVRREVELLRPHTVVLGHHDNWMPPLTREGGTDVTPIREALGRMVPRPVLLEPGYLESTRLLG